MQVRVRGVYSTAITKILLDNNISVSHTSKIIRERFSLPENREAPTVTVKDTDDKHGVVIVGEYEDGKKVYEVIKERVKNCICWVSKLPLHSIIKGKVIDADNNKSIVDLGEYKGIINKKLEAGSEVLVDIAKPFFPHEDVATLSERYTVYGKYVALIYGLDKKVIFSKHITNKRLRDDLLSLAMMSNIENWSIKWRSSAILGEFGDMLKDLQQTYDKAKDIIKAGQDANVGEIVYKGEFFAIVAFSKNNKLELDNIRNDVLPTILGHHSLKSMNESELVDIVEHLLANGIGDREKISEAVINYIKKLMTEKLISIQHISLLSGEIKRLTPGKVIEIENGIFKVKRIMRSKGILDGLNMEKLPGDYDIMEFSLDKPIVLHKYFGKTGEFKGIYVNLNTPPEISRDSIRYIDVEIDVVATENDVKIIDSEKLLKAKELGIISEEIKNYYLNLAEEVKNKISEFDDLRELSITHFS